MPRQPKPYLRKQTGSWYCSIGGRQIALGKDREAAHAKFYELMADREQVRSTHTTLYELSQAYLDWCLANRKPATYERHRYYLRLFIESVGKRMRPNQLKVHHVVKWHEGLGVSTTTQNDAVGIVLRLLNWSVEQEYLARNPLSGMRRPRRRRRDVFYTSPQWDQIRDATAEPLRSLLTFLYLTGCRPLELRTAEASHPQDDLEILAKCHVLIEQLFARAHRRCCQRPLKPMFRQEVHG